MVQEIRDFEEDYDTQIFRHQFNKWEVETINIVSHQNIPNGADSWDVSEDQDGTVMAWLVDEDSDNMYELYIGANSSKIYANPNSKGLFSSVEYLKEIRGFEHFNTSKVTDMSEMFANDWSLTSLDLSYFNTDIVTDMLKMFYDCEFLITHDLSHFNTQNVTNMASMFWCVRR